MLLLASSAEKPRVLLKVQQCAGQPPAGRDDLAQNVTEVDKPYYRVMGK